MLDSIIDALQQTSSRPLGLLFALVLGILSAAVSACCVLPTLGALIGYSGAQGEAGRRLAFKKALFFTLGIIVSITVIGVIVGFAGKVAYASLGRYWKMFAGVAIILLGLATLKALPLSLPSGKFDGVKNRLGTSGVVLAGFVLGGLVAVSSMCCNPGLFILTGVAMMTLGEVFRTALLFGMFAVGFSLPFGAILFGISLTKARFLPKGADAVVRWIAGGLLLVVGFYFLVTF